MGKKTQKDTGSGNTKSPTPKEKELRQVFFTWNNYTKKDIKTLRQWFDSRKNILYVFQEEMGEKGTPHLQGCFKSKSPIKWSTLRNTLKNNHIEKCGNWNEAIKYCSKTDTRNGKIYTNIDLPEEIEPIIDEFDEDDCKEWQRDALELVKTKPDPRKIYVYVGTKGGEGKSRFARHLLLKYRKSSIMVSGKAADAKYAIQKYCFDDKGNQIRNLRLVIFDIPRSSSDFVSYQAIEEIKNATFLSTKYESGMVILNPPHILIFTNEYPKTKLMSKDRWVIQDITLQ